jgi:hypothetical protein
LEIPTNTLEIVENALEIPKNTLEIVEILWKFLKYFTNSKNALEISRNTIEIV